MRTKITTLLLLVGIFIGFHAQAQFAGGNGTASTPYLISTPQQLDSVRHYLDRPDLYFKLTQNIDLSGYDTDTISANGNWTPLGGYIDWENNPGFRGHFDGNGFSVLNMFINNPYPEIQDQGLFGDILGGTVRNLGIANANIIGGAYVGLLAGVVDNAAKISKCYASGEVTGMGRNIGGLIGAVHANDTLPVVIEDCYTHVNVKGTHALGGIAGFHMGTINRCYATGSIQASGCNDVFNCENAGLYLGGISGLNGHEERYTDSTIPVKNSIALNSFITNERKNDTTWQKNVGRIGASELIPHENCYAVATLKINDSVITNGSKTNKDGEDVGFSEIYQQSTYENKLGWDLTNNWTIPAGGGLPGLKYVADQTAAVDVNFNMPSLICQGTDIPVELTSSLSNPTFRIYKKMNKTELQTTILSPIGGKYIYTISNISDEAIYFVSVENAVNPESNTKLLQVTAKAKPQIFFEYMDVKTEFDTVTFSIFSETPDSTLSYQWYFNHTLINGVTGISYTIPNCTGANNGTYTVVATNNCGAKDTTEKQFTINKAFRINATYKPSSISMPYTGQWISSDVTLALTNKISGVNVQYTVKNSNVWNTMPASLLLNAHQDTTYLFRAEKNGMFSYEQSQLVRIDTIVPDFTLSAIADGQVYTGGKTFKPVVITLTAANSNPSGVNYTYFFDGPDAKPLENQQVIINKTFKGMIPFMAISGAGQSAFDMFSVEIEIVPVSGITLDNHQINLKVDENQTLHATINPDTATNTLVDWISRDTAIAKVDNNGTVTGKTIGTTYVVAVSQDGSFKDSCLVTVIPTAVTSIVLNKHELSLKVDSSETLVATILPENATNKNVTWTSRNANVAMVNNGIVTAKEVGTTYVIAITEDGNLKDSCLVTISENVGIVAVQSQMQNIKVYPNPTFGQLRIENGKLRIENIQVFDIVGKLVFETKQTSFNISHLPNGIYSLKIFTDNGVVVKKVVKE